MVLLCAVFNQLQQKTITGIVHLRKPIFVSILVVGKPCPGKMDSFVVQMWWYQDYRCWHVSAGLWEQSLYGFLSYGVSVLRTVCLIVVEMPGTSDFWMLGNKGKCPAFPLWLPKHEVCCRSLRYLAEFPASGRFWVLLHR